MSPIENRQIQELRVEVQLAFTEVREALTDLTAEQRAHIAAHTERDRATFQTAEKLKETAVTRRWVVGVVISALAVMTSIFGVAIAALRLVMAG